MKEKWNPTFAQLADPQTPITWHLSQMPDRCCRLNTSHTELRLPLPSLSNLLLSHLPIPVVVPPSSKNLGLTLKSSLPSPAPAPTHTHAVMQAVLLTTWCVCLQNLTLGAKVPQNIILPWCPAKPDPSPATSSLVLIPVPASSLGSLPLL